MTLLSIYTFIYKHRTGVPRLGKFPAAPAAAAPLLLPSAGRGGERGGAGGSECSAPTAASAPLRGTTEKSLLEHFSSRRFLKNLNKKVTTLIQAAWKCCDPAVLPWPKHNNRNSSTNGVTVLYVLHQLLIQRTSVVEGRTHVAGRGTEQNGALLFLSSDL